MAKGYVIAHVSVKDPEAFRLYVENNLEVVARYGGTFLVKGGGADVQEGSVYATHVIVEFPNYAQAKEFYEDPVYKEVAQFRYDAGESVFVLVEGVDQD